jgi:hypothetical protein
MTATMPCPVAADGESAPPISIISPEVPAGNSIATAAAARRSDGAEA